VVGAYVLAAELAHTPGDPQAAFTRYEARMRKAVSTTQDSSRSGPIFAPKSRFGIAARNWFLNNPFFLNQMLKQAQKLSMLVELPEYGSVQKGELVQE
jgi:2-polyprenyl-6-methoxyphenol hydroxylase-like FAD-dependent oxidoreductase